MIATTQLPTANEFASHQQGLQFFIGLMTGAFLGWFGHVLTSFRDNRNRIRRAKDEVLAVVSRTESELDGCNHIDGKTKNVHTASLAPLRSAIFSLQPYISIPGFDRLLELWHEYESYRADATTTMERLAAHDIAGRDPQDRPAYPDDMMRSYFKRFRAEINSAT